MLVFIHGGLFTSGSADVVGADLIMDEEVVFVTIQYRLAALGKRPNYSTAEPHKPLCMARRTSVCKLLRFNVKFCEF